MLLRRFKKDKRIPQDPLISLQDMGSLGAPPQDMPPLDAQGGVKSSLSGSSMFPRHDVFVKSLPLLGLEHITSIGDEVRNGNIVILNTEPMSASKKQRTDLRRAIDQLRGICREFGGDLAQLGESYFIVVVPGFIKIWERQDQGEEAESPQRAPMDQSDQ